MKEGKYIVFTLELENGQYEGVAWCKNNPSNKMQKYAFKKFKNDKDVIGYRVLDAFRFFDTIEEMKRALPELRAL